MIERGSAIVKGPWPQYKALALDDVCKITQNFLLDIAEMRKSILRVRKLFTKTIWPDQCDEQVKALREVSVAIQRFYKFLDTSERLPLIVCSRRYPLVKALHHIDTLLSELIILITAFRSNGWKLSGQSILQREEIQQKLEKLLQSWKEMQRNVHNFFNQLKILLGDRISSDRPLATILDFKTKKAVLPNLYHQPLDTATAEVQHQNEEVPVDL
jgi:ACT domain-containing protein